VSPPVIATVGHGSATLWYLTRSTGLVALIVLSATVVIGIVASVGWTADRWPRFVSQAVHRNLSLFCLALITVHVISTVGDGYVPIDLADAFVPFRSPYRPLWVGLGALAFDLLLAVAITSALRRRIGFRAWRGVHWLAYLCWPIAVFHGLGAGSDTRLSAALMINIVCGAAVTGALGWRLVTGRALPEIWRFGAGVAGIATVVAIAAFALIGPLRPGWSSRAGTSSALLAKLSGTGASSAASPAGVATAGPPSTPGTVPVTVPSGDPEPPFSSPVSGTYAISVPDTAGQVTVTISLRLAAGGVPLVITLTGTPVGGGVSMNSSQVSLGTDHGEVTGLDGPSISATVSGSGGRVDLTLQVNLDRRTGTVTGTVSGQSAGR
jgi:DMSO/TMAO reductase YedYZ heme-binding membrane subunit